MSSADREDVPGTVGPPVPGAGQADHTAAPSRPLELITAASVLLVGALMLGGARLIALRAESGGIDPRWWPTAIAVGMVACGAWMAFNAVTGRRLERSVQPASRTGWIQAGVTVAGLAVVLALWQVGVHFLVLAPAYLLGLNALYGLRGWRSLVLFPAGVALLLFLIFQLLLKVPL